MYYFNLSVEIQNDDSSFDLFYPILYLKYYFYGTKDVATVYGYKIHSL